MTALRRTVRINCGPMRPLDLETNCNKLNKNALKATTTNVASDAKTRGLRRRS